MRRPTFSFNEFPWERFSRQDFYAPLLHFSGSNRSDERSSSTADQIDSAYLRFSTHYFDEIIWMNNYSTDSTGIGSFNYRSDNRRFGQRVGGVGIVEGFLKFFFKSPFRNPRNPTNKGAERKKARATFGPSTRELSPIFGSSVEERKGGNAVSSLPKLFRCPLSCALPTSQFWKTDATRLHHRPSRDRSHLTRRAGYPANHRPTLEWKNSGNDEFLVLNFYYRPDIRVHSVPRRRESKVELKRNNNPVDVIPGKV